MIQTSIADAASPPDAPVVTSLPPAPPGASPAPVWNWRRILLHVAVIAVLLDVALFAALAGLRVRKWAFIATDGAHFQGDIRNAFRWGTAAQSVGILNLYDHAISDMGVTAKTLDYPPLRLTVAWQWVRWANRHYPGIRFWQDDYELTRPMLNGNTVAELVSSVLVFLLIQLWVRRADDARRATGARSRAFRGVASGMAGALLFWFNPAVIWVSHCWPQWDVWLIPFFLSAILLASVNWWFAAGMALMVGAGFKGQILLGAPVLLLWPLFTLRFGAVLRLLAGFFFAAALITLPWIKIYTPPTEDGVALWNRGAVIWCAAVGTIVSVLAVAGFIALRHFHRRTDFVFPVWTLVMAAAVFATIPLFGANDNWYKVGFKHGAEKYREMIVGRGVWNIAKMQQTYGFFGTSFSYPDEELALPVIHKVVTYRTATLLVYGACLALCGVGAAMHGRRRRADPRFLVAMVTPWLCMMMLLTQMHGRYLMYAAGLSALLAGVSVGMALLGVLVSVISTLGTIQNQYMFAPSFDPEMLRFVQTLDPHVGWMLLTIMLVWLYVAVTPGPKRSVRFL